jgi:hypothetical protein
VLATKLRFAPEGARLTTNPGVRVMGLGDQIIASGLARNAWAQRGRKVAFGDGQRIIWDKHSKEVFQNNPNVCFPGNERSHKLEWIAFHKGIAATTRKGRGTGSGTWTGAASRANCSSAMARIPRASATARVSW